MTVFEDPFCPLSPGEGQGQLSIMIDTEGSADFDSLRDTAYAYGFYEMEVCGDLADLDVLFTPPVVVTYPTEGTTATGDTPTMQWENYADTYQAATGNALSTVLSTWSYVWYASERGGDGFPVVLWGLPNTDTSFDFTDQPTGTEAFDVLTLMASSSATDLSSATEWQWSVLIVDCDFQEYVSGTASVYTDCVQELLDAQGQTAFSRAGEIEFDTD
jgi:hypothetical protein